MVPVFSGHTGVTNVELLIYIFVCGGRVRFQLYTETHFILLFVRVGIFWGERGGGYKGWDNIWQNFRDPTTHTNQPYSAKTS